MLDLSRKRTLVQPLDVALGEHVDGTANVDLDEPADAPAHLGTRVLVRGDGGGDGDDAIASQQLRDKSDATDVDVAIFFAESQSRAEGLTHLIAVEHLDAQTAIAELGRDPLSDRRFPGPGQAGEPDGEPAHPGIAAATA